MQHPNHADSIEAVLLAVAAPLETAARLSRLIGSVVVPDAVGAFALELEFGSVRISQAELPAAPRVTGLMIRTSDGNAAITRLVSEHGIAHRREGNAVVVDPAAAGGVALHFLP